MSLFVCYFSLSNYLSVYLLFVCLFGCFFSPPVYLLISVNERKMKKCCFCSNNVVCLSLCLCLSIELSIFLLFVYLFLSVYLLICIALSQSLSVSNLLPLSNVFICMYICFSPFFYLFLSM